MITITTTIREVADGTVETLSRAHGEQCTEAEKTHADGLVRSLVNYPAAQNKNSDEATLLIRDPQNRLKS